MDKIRVAIADDNKLMADVLEEIIQQDQDMEIVGKASDGEEVYQLIRDGVSDMHCMSDMYLAEELEQEYANKIENDTNGVKTN